MKRYAIFAHYDSFGHVAGYVYCYLKSLKEVADYVVFVSDGALQKEDKQKLQKQVDFIIDKRHGEYDFGSYKRGFQTIEKKLSSKDELILCNDSCFGPFISLKSIFEEMSKSKASMWGLIDSNDHQFLMSFFLVLKSNVFSKDYFKKFLMGVQKENNKDDVVLKYEHRLSQLVRDNEGNLDCWLNTKALHHLHKNNLKKFVSPQIFRFMPKTATSDVYGDNNFYLQFVGFPFIKKLAFKEKRSFFPIFWKNAIQKYDYPTHLITDYLSAHNFPKNSFNNVKYRYYMNKFKKFLFYKKVKNNETKIKILGLPVFKGKTSYKLGYLKYLWEKEKLTFLYYRHKISKVDFKKYKKELKEKMILGQCRLGVAYNVFDGEELLEDSIKSIRSVASHVVVVWQKISNFKEKANPELEPLLLRLKEQGLIDELYLYTPKFNQKDSCYNEKRKRDIGLHLVKKAGCNYFLSMDTDEFYCAHQLSNALKYIHENNIQSSAVSITEYLKDPRWQIINGYAFAPSEHKKDYTFYCPFIMKIHHFKTQHHNSQNFPCWVDPTRGLNCLEKFYLFPKHTVVLHHMSTVRKNLALKYKNSNLRRGNKDDVLKKLQNQIISYRYDKNLVQLSQFNDLYVQKVPNIFNIRIKGDK